MERKRSRPRSAFDDNEEEEEEEFTDRRSRLRERKRIRYTDDDGDAGHDYNVDDEEEEEDKHNQMTQKNNLMMLRVSCGTKHGTLHVERLHNGEKCIQCEGCWLTPNAFEDLGGKGTSKKWKASIFYDGKPLQFLFEQGYLFTNGYKRKRINATTKQKKLLPSNDESEEVSDDSEIQCAEETEEEDVKDEDYCPGSLETEEREEEMVECADLEDTMSEEEQDRMEDEDVPADADHHQDNCVIKDEKTKSIISTSEKIAKITLKRLPKEVLQSSSCTLPQGKSDRHASCTEHLVEGSWSQPLNEDAQSEEEREHSGSAVDALDITADTHDDLSQMSAPLIIGGIKEEIGVEFMQSNEREDKQRDNKTESPLSAPATSSPGIMNNTEDVTPIIIHTTSLCPPPVPSHTVAEAGFTDNMTGDWDERGDAELDIQHCENTRKEHSDVSRSEDISHMLDRSDMTSDTVQRIKRETIDPLSPPSEAQHVLVECTYENVTSSGHDAAQLQVTRLQTCVHQTSQASDCTRPSASSDVDVMDLDQLKREKIKMQLKVLKLQEEYYSLKINNLKN